MKRWSTNPANAQNGPWPERKPVNFARLDYDTAQVFVEEALPIADQSPDDFYVGTN